MYVSLDISLYGKMLWRYEATRHNVREIAICELCGKRQS